MKKLLSATAVALVLATAPAFANQCPTLIKNATDMMSQMSLDDATKAKVMDLLAKAQKEHDAGKHKAAEKDAKDAMKAIGM